MDRGLGLQLFDKYMYVYEVHLFQELERLKVVMSILPY